MIPKVQTTVVCLGVCVASADVSGVFACLPHGLKRLQAVEPRHRHFSLVVPCLRFDPWWMFQDLFASKSEDERDISAANSTTANKAYQTLVQPMARVKYLVRPPINLIEVG